MTKLKYLLIAFFLILVGCSQAATTPTLVPPSPSATITPTLGKVGIKVTSVPDAQTAVNAYLQAWKDEDYPKMYDMLTSLTRDAITEQDFEKRYRTTAISLTLKSIDYQILSSLVAGTTSAQAAYRVTFKTTLLNDITRDMVMAMSLEGGVWKVQWEEGMILPELRGGNVLQLEYKVPMRGNIYDRNGNAIVALADAVALGVVPGELNPDQETTMLKVLSKLTGLQTDYIHQLYQYQNPTWYIPIGDTSVAEANTERSILNNLSGVYEYPFRSRYYFDSGIAPQTTGYVLSISKDQLEEYQRLGYQGDEKIGADGLEAWGEQYLAGKHGATLYVKDSQGQIVTRIAQSDLEPAQSIYTTIDKDLQNKLQASFGNYNGAAIVMELDTGRILAMVSSPNFDPNLFEPTNRNTVLQSQMLSSPDKPLYNRATKGVFPLGSVFKIVTMSAALQSGLYTKDTTYMCGQEFTELPGVTLYDWTYTYKVPASGLLTLPQGLMRSCNPFFWHIGLDLYQQGHTLDVSNMARAFGLGTKTGVVGQFDEEAGAIPDPASEGDAVQLAIGQGAMLVTPLQVVDFVAAVGNGGTLYTPQLVDKIVTIDGQSVYTFQPKVRGTLPVSQVNLKIVQAAMRSVVADKRGTAYYALANLTIPVAGKTGTAQNPNGEAHAWFTGYSMANRTDKPDIAVVVLVENGGEGSEMAAPIFRRAISLYFSNNTNSGGTMPWEASPYVEKSPTPSTTDTPTPTPTAEATPAP